MQHHKGSEYPYVGDNRRLLNHWSRSELSARRDGGRLPGPVALVVALLLSVALWAAIWAAVAAL
jgi:hypothetical protein